MSYLTAAEMEVYFSQRRTFDEKMHENAPYCDAHCWHRQTYGPAGELSYVSGLNVGSL